MPCTLKERFKTCPKCWIQGISLLMYWMRAVLHAHLHIFQNLRLEYLALRDRSIRVCRPNEGQFGRGKMREYSLRGPKNFSKRCKLKMKSYGTLSSENCWSDSLLINNISMIMTKDFCVGHVVFFMPRLFFFMPSCLIKFNLFRSTHSFWNDSWGHFQISRLSQSSLIIWWILHVVV